MLYFIIAVIVILPLLLIEFKAVATLPQPPRRGWIGFIAINTRTNYNAISCNNIKHNPSSTGELSPERSGGVL